MTNKETIIPRNKSLVPLWMYANYDYKAMLYHWFFIRYMAERDAMIETWKLKYFEQ